MIRPGRPMTQREAFAYIREHHRHHAPPRGDIFRVCASDEVGNVIGVALVGRPVARRLQDGWTCEVTRLCTDGSRNACSYLYARCRRAAIEMGYRRGITYILASESGASLRAAGWRYLGESESSGDWNVPSRARQSPEHLKVNKKRYGWGEWPSLEEPDDA